MFFIRSYLRALFYSQGSGMVKRNIRPGLSFLGHDIGLNLLFHSEVLVAVEGLHQPSLSFPPARRN